MIARAFHWALVIFLVFTGAYCLLLGGYLLYLGGSAYYLLTGVATLVIARALYKHNPLAIQLYGGLLALTLLWAIYESDGDFLSLLPRLAMWMVLGLWFLLPAYARLQDNYAPGVVTPSKHWVALPWLVSAITLGVSATSGYTQLDTGTVRNTVDQPGALDWRHYGNTAGGSRFMPADQITRDNVGELQELWRYRTGVEDDFKMTPLQVNGKVYVCGARNIMIAIDDSTGEEIWRHDPDVEIPGEHQYARTCRGLSYHASSTALGGTCAQRIVTGTVDARLVAVDAHTGERCPAFGDNGSIDLRKGLGEHLKNQFYVTSPPVVAGDLLVTGGLVLDSQDLGLPSGVVRAYHAETGEFAWAWDLGNPGVYTEPAEGETYTPGTPNVWTVMSYDEELDLVYAPTGNANPDYYGGLRRDFDDEWSSALVALNAQTGEPVWKFQTVYHDVWDFDLPAQPVLVDVEKDGREVPAIVVPTKRGDVFVLDRRDGSPVHPIVDKPVPQDPAPTEYLSPTQPFTETPSFHPYRHEKDMWGLTPLDQLLCRVEYKMMRYEGLFTPPSVGGSLFYPANFGGFNWGSVSVDADHGLLVAAPMMLANRHLLVTRDDVQEAGPRAALLLGEDHPAVRLDADAPIVPTREPNPDDPYDHHRIKYYGLTLPFMSRFYVPLLGGTQVPCFEPPWSRLAVIDLNTNELMWSRPVGSMKDSGPFGWRSGLPFQVGTPIRAGTMTTRGGLTFLSSTMDSTVRAFDVRTGEVKWSQNLPASGQATPMSYVSQTNGKQYVIVTVPNPSWRYPRDPETGTYTDSRSAKDGLGGYVIAYGLPD